MEDEVEKWFLLLRCYFLVVYEIYFSDYNVSLTHPMKCLLFHRRWFFMCRIPSLLKILKYLKSVSVAAKKVMLDDSCNSSLLT